MNQDRPIEQTTSALTQKAKPPAQDRHDPLRQLPTMAAGHGDIRVGMPRPILRLSRKNPDGSKVISTSPRIR